MMICEKCEKELASSIGACSACGHNPVLQRMDVWRERRTQQLSSINQTSTGKAEGPKQPARTVRTSAKDATLIRFPQRVAPQPPIPPTAQGEGVPAWKERLNSRLQEIREQREPTPVQRQAEEKFDRNPIIANALNRINRANYLQPITPHSRSSAAAELAPATMPEVSTNTIPYIETTAPPIISRNPSTSYLPLRNDSDVEMVSPILQDDEDLLSEIQIQPLTSVIATAAEAPSEHEVAHVSQTTLEAASLGKRVAAAVIDAEIIASSLLPLFGAYFFLSGWFDAPTIYVPLLVAVVLITVYFFVTYALAGRTMGMAWCNLHLASLSSNPDAQSNQGTITFTITQAVLRALGGTISLLLFPLNLLCILRSDDRLGISDYLSNTQVVRIRK